MLGILIIIILICVLCYALDAGENKIKKRIIESLKIGGLLGILFGLITMLLVSAITYAFIPTEYTVKSSIKLTALQNTDHKTGTYYLGIVNIDHETYYTYETIENGYYKIKQIKNTDDISKEYTNGAPHIDKIKKYPTNEFLKLFLLNLNDTKTVIYIPNGTVLENYNVDLQ